MSKLCGTSCEIVKDELGGEASQREILSVRPLALPPGLSVWLHHLLTAVPMTACLQAMS